VVALLVCSTSRERLGRGTLDLQMSMNSDEGTARKRSYSIFVSCLATVARVLAVSVTPGSSESTRSRGHTCYPEATNAGAVPAVVLRVSMLTEEEELFELDDDDDELLGVLGGVWATPARPVLLLQGRAHSKPPPQGELNSDNDRWEECGMREMWGRARERSADGGGRWADALGKNGGGRPQVGWATGRWRGGIDRIVGHRARGRPSGRGHWRSRHSCAEREHNRVSATNAHRRLEASASDIGHYHRMRQEQRKRGRRT